MKWPQKIIIVDDSFENAEKLKKEFEHLNTWFTSPQYQIRDELINDLTERIKSNRIEIIICHIFEAGDIGEAIAELETKTPAIAFIDFDLTNAEPEAIRKIDEEFNKLPEEVKEIAGGAADSAAKQLVGGTLFYHIFQPNKNIPRVMVPATISPPSNLPISPAITGSASIRGGIKFVRRAIMVALDNWIGLVNECPLDTIWDNTGDWFSNHSTMTHEPPSSDRVKSYKKEITKAFDLTLPDGWFENNASLDVLNEALKHLCGYHYCGTGNDQSNKNLTLGSVYLIALTAMHEATKDISILTEGIRELEKYHHVFSRRFLLKQGGAVAKETARSLYFLFKNLFSSKQQNSLRNAKKEETKVDKFIIDHYGKKLKFTFNWSAHSEYGQNHPSIEMQIRRLDKIELSDDYSKALTSLQNLWIYMLRSEKGFGNPGSVWMDTKTLCIASANSPFTVLIVCDDDARYKKWADKLLSAGALEIFVLTNDSDVKVVHKNSLKWPEDAILDDIPKELDCMLIHYSNRGFIKGRFKAGKTFSFNASGNPSVINGGLKILRETSPMFDISSHEVKEIIEYCIGDRGEIPSCCKQKKALDYLPALTILCQGYLAVHAEYKEQQDKDWKDQDIALEQIGWDSVDKSLIPRGLGKKESIKKVRNPGWWWAAFEDDFKNKDKKGLPVAIQEEWNTSTDKEISKDLEDLIKLIVADNEVKPPEMVAKAYLALVEKLGG